MRGNFGRLMICLGCRMRRRHVDPSPDVVAWYFDPGCA